ncbi:MAG: YmfQ family protein [Ruminococcus sp.]|nr:YmfQ family protein [Ruminococcus sp.]
MSRADSFWKCKYDELITFYPRYYRDVFEMDAILRAEGGLADGAADGMNKMLMNNFIDGADEDTIYLFEKFLGLSLMRQRTLEERRRMTKSYFAGQGKVSATRIRELIYTYTGADTTCEFYPFDSEGNNRLDVIFERGSEGAVYISDIYLLLSKMLPAHIEYRAIVAYRYKVVIGKRRTHYKYGYDICGTKPETVLIAQIEGTETAVEVNPATAVMNYRQITEKGTEAGVYPRAAVLARIENAESVTSASDSAAVMTYMHSTDSGADSETGIYPQTAALGHKDAVDAATEAYTSACGVDYIPCGVIYSGTGG